MTLARVLSSLDTSDAGGSFDALASPGTSPQIT